MVEFIFSHSLSKLLCKNQKSKIKNQGSSFMTSYLQKRTLFPPQIATAAHPQTGIIVVIPCYDEPDLVGSLQALANCKPPNCMVEVIVVINSSEKETAAIKAQNETSLKAAKIWIQQQAASFQEAGEEPFIRFYILHHPNLPHKHAGVGLARKIGMDEAVYRLESIGKPTAIIDCFDADSQCANNYLQAIEQHFEAQPKSPACSIYYEHPIEGTAYKQAVYNHIIQYELYLRYYVHALRFANYPFAYQTIGSSMAARCNAYQQQGGMNRRKAGEDFYFLHKFTHSPHFSEIKNTKVIPASRPSHRVPFGTGKAIGDMLESKQTIYYTYAPDSFEDLKMFIQKIPNLYNIAQDEKKIINYLKTLPPSIASFLTANQFVKHVVEISNNTSHAEAFKHRFFRWFDAFKVLKFVHFARDNYYPNLPVGEAAVWLFQAHFKEEVKPSTTLKQLLEQLRVLDQIKKDKG